MLTKTFRSPTEASMFCCYADVTEGMKYQQQGKKVMALAAYAPEVHRAVVRNFIEEYRG